MIDDMQPVITISVNHMLRHRTSLQDGNQALIKNYYFFRGGGMSKGVEGSFL